MDAKKRADLEAALSKSIREADKDFKTLELALKSIQTGLNTGKLNQDSIKKAQKAVYRYLQRHKGITTIKPKILEQLDSETEAGVILIDKIYAQLLGCLDDLKRAESLSKKKPDKPKDLVILIDASTRYAARLATPPKGVGQLVKTAQAVLKDPGYKDSAALLGFGYLPLAVIYVWILTLLIKQLRGK